MASRYASGSMSSTVAPAHPVHLGGWLVINQVHLRPGRLASVTALDPGGLEKVGLRFFVWIFTSLFATFAPKALRPRLASWLEQPVLVVPELRRCIQAGVRAFRIPRPAPLPLTDDELPSIRTPFYLITGKHSLLVHPKRQLERVPGLIPGARAEIVAATGHGPRRHRRVTRMSMKALRGHGWSIGTPPEPNEEGPGR